MRRALLAVMLAACLTVALPTTARAQDPPVVQVPTQDIVPEPNSGHEPSEAGDRGGALQLLVFGLVVAMLGGATWHLVRQARRARADG
jgi:hypothetical protein